MIKKTLRDIKLKDGEVIPAGTEMKIEFAAGNYKSFKASPTASFCGRFYKLGFRNAKKNFGAPFTSAPSLRTMENWSNDGIARTVTGERTEPDGFGSNNAPSWMLALGLI